MADVGWIKQIVGMFDGKSFKRIKRAKIGGEKFRDKLTAVWFELMDLAGQCNRSGALIDSDDIPYSDAEDIATMLDREPEEVELCLRYFINERMIAHENGIYTIAKWGEYQNEKGLEEIRQKNRERQAKFRAKQKLMLEEAKSNVTDNVTVTLHNAIDKDKEKEEDREIYITIVSYLNEKAGTKYKATTSKTKSAINARLSEGFTVEDFKTVIDKKCAEWIGDEKMEKYLRPETLFGTKFEGYLNAKTGRNDTHAEPKQDVRQVRKYGNYI